MLHAEATESSIPRGRITPLQSVVLALLLAGAGVNLIAGARRPLRERAILRQGHYAAAEEAREAIERHLPGGEPVNLVVYAGDYVGAMDGSVWAVIYMRWLLYPRRIPFSRRQEKEKRQKGEPSSVLHLQSSVSTSGPTLFFHTTAPPALPAAPTRLLARGRTWVLADISAGRTQ